VHGFRQAHRQLHRLHRNQVRALMTRHHDYSHHVSSRDGSYRDVSSNNVSSRAGFTRAGFTRAGFTRAGFTRRRAVSLLALLAAGSLAVAGCNGATAAADDAVSLDYWLWDA